MRTSSSERSTHSSLPSGSARTTQPVPSGLRRSCSCRAPSARTRASSSSRVPSRGRRSRWNRLRPGAGSASMKRSW
ncbi:hypothetical protein E8D37_06290 [Nocardioides sp. GY 10127]|nr:hypothetical protein E8D37_06290 [Nocardioides sp. GY 10127]